MLSMMKELEAEAMRLPPRSRARLAERLIASLEQEPADPHAEKLWTAEAQRRVDELAGGKLEAVPAETVLARARAALG
jgi:putative addiction module component (TIGR02574 family)